MADQLKVIMKPMANGQLTPLLCMDNGEPLPGQVRVEISTSVDDMARVTVEFIAVAFE